MEYNLTEYTNKLIQEAVVHNLYQDMSLDLENKRYRIFKDIQEILHKIIYCENLLSKGEFFEIRQNDLTKSVFFEGALNDFPEIKKLIEKIDYGNRMLVFYFKHSETYEFTLNVEDKKLTLIAPGLFYNTFKSDYGIKIKQP